MSPKPELVQFGDLTREHFDRHPVWLNCHVADYEEPWYDETDEETFRPWLGPLPAGPSEGMLLASATFVFADGSKWDGFLTPAFPDDPLERLGLIQPQVFLPGGGTGGFWEGGFPRDADVHAAMYRALGKTAAQVFPASFSARPGLVTGVAEGELLGFYSRPKGNTVNVTT